MITSFHYRASLAGLVLAAVMLLQGPAASAPAPSAAPSPVTIRQEIELGNEVADEVRRKSGGLWNNPAQLERVKRIAFRLFAVSDRHENARLAGNFTVELLDTRQINAFCVPGGHTFVTRGLIELGLDDDELACVMGHEIAHAARRHGARNIEASKLLQARVEQMTQRKTLRTLAQIPILLYMFKRFDPQLEFEADYYGTIYAHHARFDPQGMPRLLRRFAQLEERRTSSRIGRLLASITDNHPPTPERVKRATEIAQRLLNGETMPVRAVPIYD